MNRTGRKQSAADGVILSSPDVLTAVRDSPLYEVNSSSEYVAQASLHFAPASLQHLLETDGYADMNAQCLNASERSLLRKTYPPHYIRRSTLGNLYALVKPGAPVAEGARTEKHDLLNGKLVPLSKESMREIVAAYVVRSQLVATPTAMSALGLSLLPEGWEKGKDAASRGGFALLISPKTKCPPDGDAANKRPAAAIVSFTTQRADGDDDANAAAFSKTKTNPLGEHCHWRGCSAIGKVRYAADLQLDIKGKGASTKLRGVPLPLLLILRVGPSSGGAQEILRHLPRKFTGAQKKSYHFFTRKASSSKKASIGNESSAAEDDDKIINASSLLTELLTRKLSATIRGFCSRAVAAASARSKQKREVEESPSPKRTKAERLESAKGLQSEIFRDAALSARVLVAEKKVATELARFAKLGIFPTDELAAIRREFKILDRERSMLKSAKKGNGALSKHERTSDVSPAVRRFNKVIGIHGVDEILRKHIAAGIEACDPYLGSVPTEGDLELDFCLRKFIILNKRRVQLERSSPVPRRSPLEPRSVGSTSQRVVYPAPVSSEINRHTSIPAPASTRKPVSKSRDGKYQARVSAFGKSTLARARALDPSAAQMHRVGVHTRIRVDLRSGKVAVDIRPNISAVHMY